MERRNIEKDYLEAEADSSSSQLRIWRTLRLKMEADCLTSLLSRRMTALTPATVMMKLVKAIFVAEASGLELWRRNGCFFRVLQKSRFYHKYREWVLLYLFNYSIISFLLIYIFYT